MADQLLSAEAVAAQLQISKEQVVELAKKGVLRGFLDQKSYKFRPADLEAYKHKLETGATQVSGTDGAPATSHVDLNEVESEADVEEADQTSVLQPAAETEPQKAPAAPVFQFSEQELGLKDEGAEDALEEGDQTSLLGPIDETESEGKAESKAAFNFSEKDLEVAGEGDTGESVLMADESESSVDILEVSDESSSESASTTSSALFAEESSGDEIDATQLEGKGAGRVDKTVTDILSSSAADESEEELAGLDLDEVIETRGTPAEALASAAAAEAAPETGEFETVGIGDESGETEGGSDEGIPTTAGVDEAIAEAVEEQVELPAAAEEEAEESVVPAGWEAGAPSRLFNGLMIGAVALLVIAGVFVFCNVWDISPRWAQPIIDMVQQK